MSVDSTALPLADVAKMQSSHPMDSSRLLLSLLDLSREGQRDARQMGGSVVCPMVLRGLLRDVSRRGVHTWDDLDDLLAARTGRARRRVSGMPTSSDGAEGA